jgi:aminoglycoside phosphotransferase (APT) family kinase protein
MKERWTRDRPEIALDLPTITELLQPVLPGAVVSGFERVSGGLINTNVKVTVSGLPRPVLLRLYQGSPAGARTEVAVAARIAGSVPVARFLYFSPRDPVTGHPYAITEWVDGERLDEVIDLLAGREIENLGRALGQSAAAIHAFAFERSGFFEDGLHVGAAIDMGRKGLLAYLRQCLVDGPGGTRLGPELTSAVMSFAEREGEVLESWRNPPCLVHGDFNGRNILVRPSPERGWEVAAILDWEFALSASPALDFGNFLRPPLGRDEELVAAFGRGYREAAGSLPPDWRHVALVADLFAWADILSRPATGAAAIADACRFLREMIIGETC